jgi:hypothetical protein
MGNRIKGLKAKKGKVGKKKSKLKGIYLRWGKVYCPALNNSVHFTHLGWNHLVERKKRSKIEYIKRLEILPYAKKVISVSTTIQSRDTKDNIEYTNLVAVVNGMTIKITITRTGRKFTFFSVRRVV